MTQSVTRMLSMGLDKVLDSAAWKDLGQVGDKYLVQLNLDGFLQKVEVGTFSNRQRRAMEFLNLLSVQITLGALISVNMVLLIIEADILAVEDRLPFWLVLANRVVLSIYVLELCARLFAYSTFFFRSAFNIVDFGIVAVDLSLEFYSLFSANVLPSVTALRVLRLARLARAYRIMSMLPVLSGMIRDLLGAMVAVGWGCLLLALVMTIWSILAAHLVHPIIEEIARETTLFDDCERCPRAFSSVWRGNLTLFQVLLAGDSWGQLALPVIEREWWTVLFFMGSFFSINIAIVNVILAVIVETAEETRRNDLHDLMRIKEAQFLSKSKRLLKICSDLDVDGSGDMTLDELLDGFENNAEFAANLHEMGIAQREDVNTIFTIMDTDRSGTVDYKEFVSYVYKMKTSDTMTLLNFIRHYVCEIFSRVLDLAREESDVFRKRSSPADSKSANVSKESNDVFESELFVEQAGQPPAHAIVKEFTVRATEVSNFPHPDSREVLKLQRDCNALLERVNNDLVNAVSEVVSASQAQVKLLQATEKSIVELLSRHSMSNACVSHFEHSLEGVVRPIGETGRWISPQTDETGQRPGAFNKPTSTWRMGCSAEPGNRSQLIIRRMQEAPE